MSRRRIILASASPSRKRLLESAGITPEILVSGVNEEDPDLLALAPSEMVIALAIMKAHTVRNSHDIGADALVIGCDSTFEFEGENLGKPLTRKAAIERAKKMRGKSGYLHTGHSVIDISTSKVTFVDMTDREIEQYVDTGEPLQVAGGFTLDGRSAPFISHIDGDPSGIIGLSLPTLRKIMINLGLEWGDLL